MPTTLLAPATVVPLVEDAIAAPSMHNAQPWRFAFKPEAALLELYADPDRTMPRSDPTLRALHLGCGAALLNLRVSAAFAGYEAAVELLPDSKDPWLLARVRLQSSTSTDWDLATLHMAVRNRHSSRFPFTDEEIPAALLDGLCAAARIEGCHLLVPDAWHTDTLLSLVHDSEHREEMDQAVRDETSAWTDVEPETRNDGIPATAFGPRPTGGSAPLRDFGRSKPVPGRNWATFEKDPCIALLGTTGDAPRDWLQAGQALERVLLQATADGLVSSMTSQPLEWPELRWALRDPVTSMSYAQMVLRLGYGPQGPATARRPASEVLDII
ncbi:Acg family FMN-binding oxidoreductase [Streptomyces sp. NPDC056002]|uniref:Acg family FMN-binding oxidoreductase n=1 Tax=Streptomyces sp. NPDC056002 TaxID=3345675 RepID=UPI0035DA5518